MILKSFLFSLSLAACKNRAGTFITLIESTTVSIEHTLFLSKHRILEFSNVTHALVLQTLSTAPFSPLQRPLATLIRVPVIKSRMSWTKELFFLFWDSIVADYDVMGKNGEENFRIKQYHLTVITDMEGLPTWKDHECPKLLIFCTSTSHFISQMH